MTNILVGILELQPQGFCEIVDSHMETHFI